MKISKFENYSTLSVKRAQKAIDLICTKPHLIGDREFDTCFEMGDGTDVLIP